jgi:hypothetical protein
MKSTNDLVEDYLKNGGAVKLCPPGECKSAQVIRGKKGVKYYTKRGRVRRRRAW